MKEITPAYVEFLRNDLAEKDALLKRQRVLLNGLDYEMKRKQELIEQLEHDLVVTRRMLELERRGKASADDVTALTESHVLLKKALDENERLHDAIRKLRKGFDVSLAPGISTVAENNIERIAGIVAREVGRSAKMAPRS